MGPSVLHASKPHSYRFHGDGLEVQRDCVYANTFSRKQLFGTRSTFAVGVADPAGVPPFPGAFSASQTAIDSAEATVLRDDASTGTERESLPLSKATEYLLEESRMVLPGMQALFGFQLIAVFNSAFSEKLGALEQRLHLAAIALVVIGIALIMTPAAYHRQTSPHAVSARLIALSTRLILLSMAPLALAICLDFYLVGWIVLHSVLAACMATGLLALFVFLWFILPRMRSRDDPNGTRTPEK
jgi:hypothetical protein